jgi:hypothetical protein
MYTLRSRAPLGCSDCIRLTAVLVWKGVFTRAVRLPLRRRGLWPALLWALAASAGICAAPAPVLDAPYRTPFMPGRDDEVIQQVPPASQPEIRALRSLRRALTSHPDSLAAAEQLAQAYIDFGREVGDAHYAGYAEAVLAPWLEQAAPPAAVLVEDATILQFRHDFAAARKQLSQALGRDAANAQAWLVLATLDMVQGDYRAARSDCSRVTAAAGLLLGVACNASLRTYTGHAEQGLQLLVQLQAQSDSARPSLKAWIEGLVAEADERLGLWSDAEVHHRAALKATPRDNFALVAYADFLLDRGRPQEVLALLVDSAQSDTAFLRLALAKAALRAPDAAAYAWIMAARFEALRQRGSEYFGREQARFALLLQHDPDTALELAARNWQVQRGPWDARVLLEAAATAKRPQAAAAVLEFLAQTQLQDPLIAPLAEHLRRELHPAQAALR